MADLIDRQKIKAKFEPWLKVQGYSEGELNMLKAVLYEITIMPSAQPERLTDDDFETIRIHLNAYKEKLCNQQRWEEADEYQRILNRFMAFASAQAQPDLSEYSDKLWRNAYERGKAEAVRHGHWMLCEDQNQEDVDNGNYLYVCSNCNHSDIHARTVDVPYCWHCGARMDEVT